MWVPVVTATFRWLLSPVLQGPTWTPSLGSEPSNPHHGTRLGDPSVRLGGDCSGHFSPACSREGRLAGDRPSGETIRTTAHKHLTTFPVPGNVCLRSNSSRLTGIGIGCGQWIGGRGLVSCLLSHGAQHPKLFAPFGINTPRNLLALFSSVPVTRGLLDATPSTGEVRWDTGQW